MHEESTIPDAKDNFEAIIDDVYDADETYVITKESGEPVAVIISYEHWAAYTKDSV